MSETSTEQTESDTSTEQSELPETVGAVAAETPVDVAQAERYGRSGDRNYRKVRSGYVVSDRMDKTVVVAIEDHFKHRRYGKIMRQTSKLKAHDEQNACGVGDRVLLMETRPLSATKRWRVVEILEKAK